MPVPGVPFDETPASASPDLLQEMTKGFAQRMMDAEVEAYGEVRPGAGELPQRVPAAGMGHPGSSCLSLLAGQLVPLLRVPCPRQPLAELLLGE